MIQISEHFRLGQMVEITDDFGIGEIGVIYQMYNYAPIRCKIITFEGIKFDIPDFNLMSFVDCDGQPVMMEFGYED